MAEHTGGGHDHWTDSVVVNYAGAMVVAALVIGLAFFIKDAPTKWIVVIVGIVIALSVVIAYGKEMAGVRKRR
jgi:cell division protein FtsW (lipid II flippase)